MNNAYARLAGTQDRVNFDGGRAGSQEGVSTSDTLPLTPPLSSIREEASEGVSTEPWAEVVALLRAKYESEQNALESRLQDQALVSLSDDNESLGSVSSVSPVSSASGTDIQTLVREKKKAKKNKDKNKTKDNGNMAAPQGEDRKDQLFFSSWGQPDARSTPRSQPRTVILSNIPGGHPSVNFTTIQSLAFDGSLERIRYNPKIDSRAYITFTSGAAAKSYYDNTANGLVYNQPSLNLRFTVMVDLSRDNEPISSRLAAQLEAGATRVVVIKNCPTDYTLTALKNIAQNKGRIVERIFEANVPTSITTAATAAAADTTIATGSNIVMTDTTNKGKGKEILKRQVTIRFTAIDFATTFFATIKRDEDFMESFIMYGADPCAEARDVHYD